MVRVSHVLGYAQQYLSKIAGLLVLIALLFSTSCNNPETATSSITSETPALFTPQPKIKQVGTPELIRELTPWLDTYEPQVQIRQPQDGQVFGNTTVSIVLHVQDLPIYKDETLNLGPHVELLLDNQPYGSMYDIEQPIILNNLTPGTHTIRAFAMRPWHESFKNEGAYAQATFHIFAKTDENSPIVNQPLLTYGSPVGTYGAEPVLLDFYLSDTPLHQVAQDNPNIADWQVRYTINGESFTLKDWESIYIEGLTPGQNWVQLTLIDDDGNPIEGVFNNTARLIEYDPSLNDTLARIIRGEVTLKDVGSIVDPTYEPPTPEIIEPEPVSSEQRDSGIETPPDSELETLLDNEVIDLTESAVSPPEAELPEIIESEESDRIDTVSPLNQEGNDSASEPTASQLEPASDSLETSDISDMSEDEAIEEILTEDTSKEPLLAPLLDQQFQSVEETDAATNSLDSESMAIPESVSPESTDATSVVPVELEETEPEASKTDNITPSSQRYLQRLYDYSDRARDR